MKYDSVICLCGMPWEFMRQRPQQLMQEMSKYVPVIYIEGGKKITEVLLEKTKGKKHSNLKKIDTQLYTITPIRFVSARKYPKIQKYFRAQMAKQINKIIKNYKFKNSILWIYSCDMEDFIDCFEKNIVVYDCVDDHAQFNPLKAKVVQSKEDKVLKKADIVFVTADQLYDKIIQKHSNVNIVYNGVDYDHFRVPDKEYSDVKVIGFIGAVYNWVDIELILKVAKAYPQHKISIVGPIKGVDIKLLKNLSNIILYGEQKYEDLSNFLIDFDICIIPFLISKLTISVNPIKVYEYLASGRPIVSTAIPEVFKFERLVYIANNHEEFISAIGSALLENNFYLKEERRKFALNNSWSNRCAEIVNILKI